VSKVLELSLTFTLTFLPLRARLASLPFALTLTSTPLCRMPDWLSLRIFSDTFFLPPLAAVTESAAVDHAVRAVERALGAGLVQTVASEGTKVLELLEIHAWMAPKEWLDRLRRAACPHGGGPVVDPSLPGEHLTDRELEVLRMLPSRLTLREIAGELFISVNTLKFHLRVIYRKLGVGSRDKAAAVARRLTSSHRARPGPTMTRR